MAHALWCIDASRTDARTNGNPNPHLLGIVYAGIAKKNGSYARAWPAQMMPWWGLSQWLIWWLCTVNHCFRPTGKPHEYILIRRHSHTKVDDAVIHTRCRAHFDGWQANFYAEGVKRWFMYEIGDGYRRSRPAPHTISHFFRLHRVWELCRRREILLSTSLNPAPRTTSTLEYKHKIL